ncbi:MAG TPA: 1,4-dihydroxy-6-naphthoate synthase, partial [Bacteroidales bacterium]|nr:1,4-dihydroxy-6-naphthoate synthase [Bacteroidales bacterium]
MHTITIGFSPCPNDTFIFDALIHNKIDTKNIRFVPYIADVEELNVLALQGKLQCTKLSFHAFAHCHSHYV